MKPKQKNVVVRFKRGLNMRYENRDLTNFCYYGEWCDTRKKPHGRGVWFAPGLNWFRIGYSNYGQPSEGEVFYVVADDKEIYINIGKERFAKGDTIFEGKMHSEGKKKGPAGCWVGKWVNGK